MSFVGLIPFLALLITKHKAFTFNSRPCVEVGKRWGGMSLGCFIFVDSVTTLHIKQHEAGHGLQNIVLGPFTPFFVSEFGTYNKRIAFAVILVIILWVIGLGMLIPGIVFKILPLIIISAFVVTYIVCFSSWLLISELPQYKYDIPEYEAAWFESSATKLGEKYFPDDVK